MGFWKSFLGGVAGFLIGGPAGAAVGFSLGSAADAYTNAQDQAKSIQEQAQRQIEQQQKQTQALLDSQSQAQQAARKKADTQIADAVGRAKAPVGSGTPTLRGTLLTGGQGVPDSKLNLGKTLLGQ